MENPRFGNCATHTILPGARILVESTKVRNKYSWATVVECPITASIDLHELDNLNGTRLCLFLAMCAFSVYFGRFETVRSYGPETHIKAYINPEDGKVVTLEPRDAMDADRMLDLADSEARLAYARGDYN